MVGFPHIVIFVALVLVPLGCVMNWWASFLSISQGEPLVPYRARKTVSWGLLDLGVAIVVLAIVVSAGLWIVSGIAGISDTSDTSSLPPAQQSALFFAFGTSTLLATALILGWLWARYQRIDGMDFSYLGPDIELGVRWFMMLIVPVILIQLVLSFWFPSHHPLVEMLQESGDLSLLPVAAFAAVISAPIFEEILFRLLLQGWMEKLQISRVRTALGLSTNTERNAVLLGGEINDNVTVSDVESVEKISTVPAPESRATDNPYAAPSTPVVDDTIVHSANAEGAKPVMWLPIIVSSALFSLAHLSHGPDWVALFLLAIGLGYLYQRTGRILPSMVVHFLVNALAMMQLWAAVLQP